MNEQLTTMLDGALASRRKMRLLRTRLPLGALDATHVECNGRRLVNFASNNYLGLTHHPRVIDAMTRAMSDGGVGSGAASLITGYTPIHEQAERAIAQWKHTQAAIILPSGYQANQAVIQALAAVPTLSAAGVEHNRDVRFLIDKLAHASLIQAVRGSGRPFRVFPHNHLSKLARLLEASPDDQLQVVVTESIFSMDGDAADLHGLAELKKRHPFVLVLDEAHAGGVYGAEGSGYAAELGLTEVADVTIVTLSKALGLAGGAICSSSAFCDAVMNFAPAAIYSTNVPPAIAGGAIAALDVIKAEPWRQERVRALSRQFRDELTAGGVSLLHAGSASGVAGGDSPIVPLPLGDENAALSAAETLRSRGFLVMAIRPPTVPRGGSRLRVTLSCEHTDGELAALIGALKEMIVR